MSELVYKSCLFSSEEFMILCALTGIEEINMFGESGRREMDEEEADRNVFQLYQKGILYYGEEGSWKVKPEIRSLFRDMRDAEKEMQIFSRKRGGSLLCFGEEHLIIVEVSQNDRDAVRMHRQTAESFFMELCDKGMLPERDSLEMEEAAEDEESGAWGQLLASLSDLIRNGRPAYDKLEKILQEREELLLSVVVSNRKLKSDWKAISVVDLGISDWIVYAGNDSVRTDYYTMDRLRAFLRS